MSGLAVLIALALKTATPGADAPQISRDAPAPDAPAPDEAVGATAFARAMEERDFAAQIADLDAALAKLVRPTRYRGMVQCYRGWVLSELRRDAESDAAIEECYRLRPDDSYAIWEMSSVALGRRDLQRGVRLLIAAIKADPGPLGRYDGFAMEGTLRQLSDAREDALRAELLAALAETNFGRDDPAWTSRHARDAIDGLLAKGDREGAVRLLPLILVPRLGLELLVDRRYEAIWPDVEAWAGGDLSAQRDAYVAAAKAAFEVDPSLDLRRNYAEALAAAGRGDAALALLKAAADDPNLWDARRDGIVMVAIELAVMIEGAGRADEALAMLRRVKAAAKDAEAAANIMPNEARLLIAMRRHGEALALLDAETPAAGGGDYAALKVCALRGLGRAADVGVLAGAGATAVAYAASCGGASDLGERLASPARRSGALVEWLAARVRSRPGEGDALFERYGRALPPSFDDALAGWAENKVP